MGCSGAKESGTYSSAFDDAKARPVAAKAVEHVRSKTLTVDWRHTLCCTAAYCTVQVDIEID